MLNNQQILNKKNFIFSIVSITLLLVISIYISFQNFLFFQIISNIFPTVIGMSMALIALNTYKISQVQYFTFLGLSYGFVAFFDALHILTHSELSLFNYPIDISINLWIVARILQSISLFVSFLNFHYKFRISLFFTTYSSISLISLLVVFRTNIHLISNFTMMFLTIIFIALSIITMFKYKKHFHKDVYYLLMISMFSLLISNAFFINFLGERNTYNALGYIFKIISFYILYKSVNSINLKQPYKSLFYKLNENNRRLKEQTKELNILNKKLTILSLKDSLTGLYNRAYFEEEIKLIDKLGYQTLAILIADLDDMKVVNDKQGHLMGDKYLKEAAKILKNSLRENDTVARIGGDEFAIVLYDIEKEDMENLVLRIKKSMKKYNMEFNEFNMCISMGWDITRNGEKTIEQVMKIADEKMYRDKMKNKNKDWCYLKVKN